MGDSTTRSVALVVGEWDERIGGPFNTVSGLASGLESSGLATSVLGLRWSGGEGRVRTRISKLRQAWRCAADVGNHDYVIFFGVWHENFSLPLVRLLTIPASRRPALALVPTMSLTTYDWGKHARVKRVIGRWILWLVARMDLVVFSSEGERLASIAPKGVRSDVVLEPLINIEPATRTDARRGILMACRLDPQKDIPLALRALGGRAELELDVIGDGDGPYVDFLRRTADEVGVASQVRWHGWKTRAEVLEAMGRASTVLVTSVIENYCHTAFEAAVRGCDVVIVDRVQSAAELVELADASVVPPEPDSVRSALLRSADGSDPDRRVARAKRVRERLEPAVLARELIAKVDHARAARAGSAVSA